MTTYKKRHQHISPTMDFAAKKAFNLHEFTARFISDILDLDVESIEILEGSQIHLQRFQEDTPFATAVDVRAKLHNGTEVIIEIQVQKQRHFLKRFNFYLADQLVENAKALREQGHTHEMYEKLSPVYGIAILEKSILPRFQSPVNVFSLRHDETFEELTIPLDDGSQQSLSKLAFIELDKYNKDKKIKDQWLQWLEYFGNYLFSKEPIKIIEVADQMLDSSRLTKEEKAMLDERLLRQEHHDMDIYSAREEGIELGIEQGIEQGLAQGIAQEKRQMVRTMFSNGASAEMIAQLTGLSYDQVQIFLTQDLTR